MTGSSYTPTESKYKGGADEHFITYDLEQQTRGYGSALYPKVRRVYVSGDVTDTEVGAFEKQSGQEVFGMRIANEQTREGYEVPPTTVEASSQRFERIEELPEDARNIRFRDAPLPERYASALQDVR